MKNNNQKRSNKTAIIVSIAALVVIGIVIAVLISDAGDKPITVTISKIERRTIVQIVSATGTIQPETQVKISPEVSGEIVELPVQEGNFVAKRTLLAKINPAVLESQLAQSKAMVNATKEDVNATKVQLDNLEVELRRTKDLYEKNFVSKQEMDKAQASFDAANANYQGAKARLVSSEASCRQIQEEFQKTTIYAPIDGVITSLLVEKNERVVGTNMMTGTEMMTVSDLNVMNAMVDVDENDIVLVNIGDTADVEIDALPDKIYKGVVVEVGHSASVTSANVATNQTTTFTVKVRLLDKEVKLRPGMSCNVDIQTAKLENVLSIPLQSVTSRDMNTDLNPDESGGGFGRGIQKVANENVTEKRKPETIVFVIEGDRVKSRVVNVGISDMGYIELISGLDEDERIVSGSYQAVSKLLSDGSKIKEDKNELQKFSKN